jgi:NAD(P)-dependent dehydrogenase (short-subunit alcohol dehydrogenase family)
MFNEPMLRDNALKGKVILVTGGGSGLGKSMSEYFLRLGAKVIISSRSEERLEEAAEDLRSKTGGEVLTVVCDVRSYENVENVLNQAVAHFGEVNGLVNNAAGNFISPTERLSHRAFDAVVDIVLRGSYNCTLALGKYWIENKIKGTVLNIITTYAWTGSGYTVPSACGKAGVLALTQSLAVEWGKYGIRMNAVAPGPFPTPGAWDRLFPKEIRDSLGLNPLERVPLGRVGEHSELANLAAFLMSDFSAYINGDAITIDGGEWLKGAGQFSMMDKIPTEMWDYVEELTRKAKSK